MCQNKFWFLNKKTKNSIKILEKNVSGSVDIMHNSQIQPFNQIGGASANYGVFFKRGRYIQKGRGLGSALTSVWRFIAPYLSSSLKSISGEALRSGAEILGELDSGAPIKDLFIKQRDKSLRNLANKAGEKLQSMSQSGKGHLVYKRKRTVSDSLSPLPKRRRLTSRKKKVVKRQKNKKGKRKGANKKKSIRKSTKRRRKSSKKVVFDKASFLNKFIN